MIADIQARPTKSTAGVLLAIVILVGFDWESQAQTVTDDPTDAAAERNISAEQCLDPQICPITYVRLAGQESEPFLFIGEVLDESHPRYDQYKEALHRFPDVRSCLSEGERTRPQPDLRQMDWDAVHDTRDIDVCVFRIATSIANVEMISAWLRGNGYRVSEMIQLYGKGYSPWSQTIPVAIVEGHLRIGQFRKIVRRSTFERLLGIEMTRDFSLVVQFSESGRVVGVISTANSTLN